MSQLNKVQVRALVRQLIDDPAGKLWNTANLDLLIEGCLDELWGELLDTFSWLRWTITTGAATTPGYLDLSNTALFARPYRLQKVIRDEVEYRPARAGDLLLTATKAIVAPDFSYAVMGTQLHLFPYALSSATVHYNSLPEPFTSLTPGPDKDDPEDDDVSFVEWPDGYHMAYVYDVAAKAIEKGDREQSAQLQKRAEMSLFRLKAFLRKRHVGPIMPVSYDDPISLGGV